jgi:hypothetical protein
LFSKYCRKWGWSFVEGMGDTDRLLIYQGDFFMSQFLVAIHHPDDFDPASEGEATRNDISALNREMIEAGVRVFVGGLRPVADARSVRLRGDGQLLVTDGPFLEAKEHVGGFWVLECDSLDEALEWGRKAAVACRAGVEVRPFFEMPGRATGASS